MTGDRVDPSLGALVGRARADLAGRLAVAVEEIEVVRAEPVVWSDAGLGCPQPGMRYLQVPVEGALIELSAAGQVYRYHTGGRRGPFLCEHPSGPAPQARRP